MAEDMKVVVACDCADEDEYDYEMEPDGPLTINKNKVQSQVYKCPNCDIKIRLTIFPPGYKE